MRRLVPITLVCALACLFATAGPALAASGHQHHHRRHAQAHAATAATSTSSATSTRSATSTSSATMTVAAVTGHGPATAKDGLAVLNDCSAHGQLTHTYPVSWLKKALSIMSAGNAEYSNCSTVLHQAVLASIHPGSGGGGGSGTTIVIIVVIVLVLLAGLLAALAIRRRRGGGPQTPAV